MPMNSGKDRREEEKKNNYTIACLTSLNSGFLDSMHSFGRQTKDNLHLRIPKAFQATHRITFYFDGFTFKEVYKIQ